MNKRQLLEWLAPLADDDEIVFAQFSYNELRGYHFKLRNQTIWRPDDPRNVLSISGEEYYAAVKSKEEASEIAKDLTRQVREMNNG